MTANLSLKSEEKLCSYKLLLKGNEALVLTSILSIDLRSDRSKATIFFARYRDFPDKSSWC